MTTTAARSRPTTVKPVRVKNAACPKCDGPVLFDPVNWLRCGGRCASNGSKAATARPIPYTPAAVRVAQAG